MQPCRYVKICALVINGFVAGQNMCLSKLNGFVGQLEKQNAEGKQQMQQVHTSQLTIFSYNFLHNL